MIREICVGVEQDRNRHKMLSRDYLQQVPKGVTESRASNGTTLEGSDTCRITTCPEAGAHMDQEIVLHTMSMNGSNEAGLERAHYAVLTVASRSHLRTAGTTFQRRTSKWATHQAARLRELTPLTQNKGWSIWIDNTLGTPLGGSQIHHFEPSAAANV